MFISVTLPAAALAGLCLVVPVAVVMELRWPVLELRVLPAALLGRAALLPPLSPISD